MTTVAELLGNLGIEVDFESVAKAQSALNQLRQSTKEAVATAELGAALKHVHGDASKAAALIGVNYDHLSAKKAQAARRAEAWGKMTTSWARTAKVALAGVASVIGGIFALRQAGQVADEYTGAASKIRGMTDDVEQQKRLQDQLYQSAQKTATGYGDVASLYQQVGKAAQANGRTLEQAAVIVDTVNMGIKASGATSEGASRALQQLSQGLGAGVLRGEEFNAVIEQAPFLIDLIAKSMGKTRPEMRKLAEEGKLTSKVVLRAFEQQRGAVETAFGKRLPQIGDFFTRMRNTLSKRLSEAFADPDVANGLAQAFSGLTTILLGVVKVAAAVGGFFARNTEVFWALVVVVGVLKLAMLALSVAATIAWIATLGPVAILIIKIAALAALVGIVAVVLRAKLGAAVRWVINLFKSLPGIIRDVFWSVINWIGDRLQALWDRIKEIANEAKNIVVGAPTRLAKSAVKGLAGSLAGVLPSGARKAISDAPAVAGGGAAVVDNSVTHQTTNIAVTAKTDASADDIARAVAAREADAARRMKAARGK
jgi:tape measure domain-containing protein